MTTYLAFQILPAAAEVGDLVVTEAIIHSVAQALRFTPDFRQQPLHRPAVDVGQQLARDAWNEFNFFSHSGMARRAA